MILLLIVLPPIPTTGLTTADVTALSIRVHDQMVEALRQISVPVPSSSAPSSSHKPTSTTPPPTSSQSHQSAPTSESTQPQDPLPSITASGPDTSTSDHPPSLSISRSESRASTTFSEELSSPTSSRHGLEGSGASGASEAGTETEEDDGMVLVGRPRE